jgi:hypothetical protein
MAGTWTDQTKVLPGAYINFQTNAPLSIATGSRGTVALLQEMSTGTVGDMYTITATDVSEWPSAATSEDKFLTGEALKNAKTVIVYNLGTEHTSAVITAALIALKTVHFDTLCYPYDAETYSANQAAIATWVGIMRNDEGVKIQAVMADMVGNSEGIINVAQGVILSDSTVLSNAQTTAWVAGATAGAAVNQSNTGAQYIGAIDVSPRMTRSQMETAVTAGKFIFKVDTAQNVTVVDDINSLTTYTATKGKMFRKNRVMRVLDGIDGDISTVWESNFNGKISNTVDGRSRFRAMLIEYFNTIQNMAAIQNFVADDVVISAGEDTDAVVATVAVQPVDSMEKLYMTVNLS